MNYTPAAASQAAHMVHQDTPGVRHAHIILVRVAVHSSNSKLHVNMSANDNEINIPPPRES